MKPSSSPVDVLVVGAHPDDAEFGMGGTLCRLADEGRTIAQVILTAGESGTHGDSETRRAEQEAASELLGSELDVLDFPDCGLYHSRELVDALVERIRRWRPRIVFAPYHTHDESHRYGSSHPDHEAAGKASKSACRFARFRNYKPDLGEPHKVENIYYYIIPSGRKPSFVIDFSDHVERWQTLLRTHASQTENLRDGRLAEFLTLLKRSFGIHSSTEYAEGFVVDDPLRLTTDALFERKDGEDTDRSQFTPF
jgi:bacillithiol biosynthesis deacetylase BshB1